jgi:hypothetical protein
MTWDIAIVLGMAQDLLQSAPPPSDPNTDLGALLAHPDQWVTAVFNAVLLALGQGATNELSGLVNGLLGGNSSPMKQTPPNLSYSNAVVQSLTGKMQILANACLVGVTLLGGINVMVKPHTRAPYHGALSLLPRLAIGAVLANTSSHWGQFAIDLNNAVCQYLGGASLPGIGPDQPSNPAEMLSHLVAFVVYLIQGLLLATQMLVRLALVDTLLIIGPLASVCWVLPQTDAWARAWSQTFFSAVFVQVVQVVVLRLGSELIGSLAKLMGDAVGNPLEGGRMWLTTLLLGVAVIQLARMVPRLMPGYPTGSGWMPRSLGVREVVTTLSGGLVGANKSGSNSRGKR